MTTDIMPNIEEFYILGLPIQTDIGIVYPTQVKDYYKLMQYGSLLLNTDRTLGRHFLKGIEDIEFRKQIAKIIKQDSFFALMNGLAEVDYENEVNPLGVLQNEFRELFEFCFKEDVYDKIKTADEFDYYLKLIRDINGIYYREPRKNALLEAYTQAEERLKGGTKGAKVSFEGKYTSIWLATGQEPKNMALYQFEKLFERLTKFKNFDLTSLYSLFSKDIQPEDWFADVKVDNEDKLIKVTKEEMPL